MISPQLRRSNRASTPDGPQPQGAPDRPQGVGPGVTSAELPLRDRPIDAADRGAKASQGPQGSTIRSSLWPPSPGVHLAMNSVIMSGDLPRCRRFSGRVVEVGRDGDLAPRAPHRAPRSFRHACDPHPQRKTPSRLTWVSRPAATTDHHRSLLVVMRPRAWLTGDRLLPQQELSGFLDAHCTTLLVGLQISLLPQGLCCSIDPRSKLSIVERRLLRDEVPIAGSEEHCRTLADPLDATINPARVNAIPEETVAPISNADWAEIRISPTARSRSPAS